MVQETVCGRCNDSCYGEVVSVQGKVYHQYCFSCIKCKKDLLKNGYFIIDGEFYCNDDYYEIHGTKCDGCGKYLEGEVVNVLDNFYHPECFGCGRCRKIFPPGVQIAYDGDDFICEDCDAALHRKELPKYEEVKTNNQQKEQKGPPEYEQIQQLQKQPKQPKNQEEKVHPPIYEAAKQRAAYEPVSPSYESKPESDDLSDSKRSSDTSVSNCAGCGNDIKSGQALLALEKQWHLWCFTCHKCGCLLAGEYMGRDGVPYCEQDYQTEFGVSCAGCGGYITGKVLQAGEKHYHPQCSRCAKCGQMFGEGEEMYLQGSEIWHPQCSEDFQREAEEADNKWLNDFSATSKDEEEPVDTSSPRSPKQSKGEELRSGPPSYSSNDKNNNPPLTNGYNNHDNDHARQASQTSSEGSMERKTHTWQPPSYSVATTSKPVGFRSVRPPSFSASVSPTEEITQQMEIPSQKDESDEEDAPPKPPPPTRTSSNAFREKYTSGVYTATPFHKPSSQSTKTRPLSYIESAARKAPTDKPTTPSTVKTTISINTRSKSGSTSSADDRTDSAEVSPTGKNYRKGVGYNKLQARKSFSDKQKPNGYGPAPDVDPVLIQKLKDDTEHPYEVLKTDSYKTPLDVDKKRLEAYLTDREFYQIFQLTRSKFYGLPKWKQDDMKKKALLF